MNKAVSFVLCAELPGGVLEGSAHQQRVFASMAGIYLPLIALLDRFEAEGVTAPLVLAVGPGALATLQDKDVMGRFDEWLEVQLAQARSDAERLSEDPLGPAAESVAKVLMEARGVFVRSGKDVLGAVLKHAEGLRLRLIPVVGTAPLPLLATDEFRWAHINGATAELEALTGGSAAGAFLPGGAWAPGLSPLLRRAGAQYTILEASSLSRGSAPLAAGPFSPVLTREGVACFGAQVFEGGTLPWRGDTSKFLRLGVGADPLAEWSQLEGESRVGDARFLCTSNPDATLYRPEAASEAAQTMAADFVDRVCAEMSSCGQDEGGAAVFAWPAQSLSRWFEGWTFMEAVLREVVESPELELTHPAGFLKAHPRCQILDPDQSSMRSGGIFGAWLSPEIDWVYRQTRARERELVGLARRGGGQGLVGRAAQAASRALAVAQSAHWIELILGGAHAEDGVKGLERHLVAVGQLLAQVAEGRPDRRLIETVEADLGLFLRGDLLGEIGLEG